MFTKGTREALAVFYRLCEYLCAYPYKWDGQRLQLNSNFHLVTFGIVCLYYMADISHLLYNLLRMVFGLIEVDSRQAFFNVSYSAWYFLSSTFSIQMMIYRKDMRAYAEELFRINEIYRTRYLAKTQKRVQGDNSELIIRISTVSIFFGAPSFGLLMFWYPDDYRYFYRFAIPYTGQSWWAMGIFGIWETYSVMTSWAVMQFCWFQFMMHCLSCQFWIKKMTETEAITRSSFASTEIPFHEKVAMYRQIQILNAEYNRINRWLFAIGLKVCTVILNAQSIYCFVLMYHVIVFFMYVCFSSLFFSCTAIIVITYTMAGGVSESTQGFVRRLLMQGGTEPIKLRKAYARSLRPFGISVGSLYKFERNTPLGVIAIVSNLSMNAILMTLGSGGALTGG